MRPWKLLRTLVILAGLGAAACSAVQPPLQCETDDDCFNDDNGVKYACDTEDTKVCLRYCDAEVTCLASQYCDIPSGATSGVCRDGDSSAGD